MNCRRLMNVFLVGMLLSMPAWAALPEPVLQALNKASLPQDSVAVFVQPLEQAQPLVMHQADQSLNPASLMKLVTTYAGLELLGPAYRWRTEIYRDADVQGGKLPGNLYLKGYGNPELMQQDLWRMLTELRQSGLEEIQGQLVMDASYFAPGQLDPGKFDNEPFRAYNTPPNALTVNLNATSFRFQSDGQQVRIQADPALQDILFTNGMKLVPRPCDQWRDKLKYVIERRDNIAHVAFSGEFPASCEEKYLELSLLSHPDYAYQLFKQLWQQLGGKISGGYRLGVVPEHAVRMMVHESQPLADVIRRINKYSNNLMARHLLLTIAAERIGLPGTEAHGQLAINSWLAGKGLAFPELVMENGSGLSRTERISAEHLGQLLVDAYASPVMAELMSSMPLLAVDGTVIRRLTNSPVQGRAHIKTGSLNGVRALAGYVLDQKGRRWVVVFISNHARAGATRAAQDALLEWVYLQP